MADVITRFKLETTQFDSKLRDTAKALQNIAHTAQFAGKDFNGFSQKSIEAARALGTVASGATNTKDKLKDLVGSYNDAAKAYNMLSEEAKKGEFGKAMAESLQKLQQDIKQTKEELYGLSGKSGGLFSGDKISGMLQVFGGNLMTKAAGMAAGFATELGDAVKQGVELAKQGEGIRIAFERLGRGDILQGLREATHGTVTDLELMKAAVKFNDFKLPVEELGTMLAFAQQKAKDTGQSVDYMVDSIVTGLGRKSLMILDNLGLSATEVKDKMKETGDMTKAVGEIIREQMAKAGDYVETAADRAAQANVSLQNKMEELGRKFAPVEEASSQLWTSMKIGILDIIGGPLATLINQLTEAGRLKNMLNSMNGESGSGNTNVDQQLKKLKVIKAGGGSDYIFNATLGGMIEDYNRQIMAIDAQVKNGGKPVGGGSGSSQDIRYLQRKMEALKIMRDQLQSGAKDILNPVAAISSSITGGDKSGKGKTFDISKVAFDINKANLAGVHVEDKMPSLKSLFDQSQMDASADAWEKYKDVVTGSINDIGDSMNDITKWTKNFDPYKEKLKEITERQKQLQMAQNMAAQAANNFGAALASIEDPAAKAAGQVISAIATITMGFAEASALASKMGPWGWIAWMAAGTAALATTISTVHSLTGYAEGGIVKGNSYSGDNVGGLVDGSQLVGLNAGELVLTKAQQSNLAQSLQGNGGQTVRVVGKLAGKDLFICAENWAKSAGKGEFVTW